MLKKLLSQAPLIIPGAIFLVWIIMFFDNAATFHYFYISETTSYPGSGWEFVFGFSADGNQILQANFVGILMLILMVISGVLVFLEHSVKNRFVWTGILLVISSGFMFAHPFASLLSPRLLEIIEANIENGIRFSVTYSLGFPLILSGILLFADGIFAFLAAHENASGNLISSVSLKSQKRPNPNGRTTR